MLCFFSPGPVVVPTKTNTNTIGEGGFLAGGLGGRANTTLPGLLACQHEIAIIEQGWQRVADSGPVLISKRVGAQIDIGPSEGLL